MENKFKKWISEEINRAVLKCGKLASEEIKNNRLQKCATCDFKGKVAIKPSLPDVDGCLKCGCPLATKASLEWIYRIEGKEEESLSENEVATLNMYKTMRMNPPKKYIRTKIECPLDKWEN